MFATIRRHQKWLWAAIIAVIIPSFVVFFTPDATLRREGGGSFGTINGRPITQQEYATAYYETMLYYFFSYGTWPSGDETKQLGFDVEREARNRVLMLDLLKQENVHVSDQAAAKWIVTAFSDRRQGGFRQDTYDQFIRQAGQEKGISERAVENFAAHQVGIQQLVSVYGGNGKLVTPRESELMYRREHEEFETEAAIFSSTNYLAGVSIAPGILSQFYSNRLSVYRIPDRVQVKYLRFELTNFTAEANQELAKQTNLTQAINAIYTQQGANFYTDTNGNTLPEDLAKAKIKENITQRFMAQAAVRKASTFAEELFKLTPMKAENLEKQAGTQYKVQITEPFGDREIPRQLKVRQDFAKQAFALTEEEPFAPPVVGEDAVYLMAYHKKLPAEYPSLDSIRPTVLNDYRKFQATQAARLAGDAFYQKLTNSIAQGKTFASVCAEDKVTPVVLPKFSLGTRDLPKLDERVDLNTLKELANSLLPGKVSFFYPTSDGGFVLHLRAKAPVDAAEMKKELPDYTKAMAQSRQYQAFNDWLGREIARSGLKEPPTSKKTAAN